MGRVLVVVTAFEDFEIGDMIIEDDPSDILVAAEHRDKAIVVAAQIFTDGDSRES